MNTLFHGGDLHSASAIYGRAPEDWLDLSTGINQFSFPAPAMGQEVWQQLPYPAPSLIEAAHSYYGQHACLACSGSQTVIQLLPVILRQLGNQKATWLPDIGYQEHRQAWSQEGEVSTYSGLDSQLATQQIADALHDNKIGHLVIINPNNPTGEIFSRQQLNLWAQQLRIKGGFLVIDEAFIDITPRASVLAEKLADNVIVLRSVGKFFGLAGIRLGFTFASQSILNQLARAIGPWSVNGPAQWVAAAALNDTDWQTSMRAQLINEGLQQLQLWQPSMTQLGAKLASTHELFRSFIMASNLAQRLHHSAAQSGILLRLVDINSNTSLLRFGNIDLGHIKAVAHCQTWIQQESE